MTLVRDTLTSYPVARAEARKHLNVDHGQDDGLIESLIAAACEALANEYNIAIAAGAYSLYLDEFPVADEIYLPLRPVTAVTAFEWTDYLGVTRSWTPSSGNLLSGSTIMAHVDAVGHQPEIELEYSASWPAETLKTSNPIRIQLTAGWTAETVPANVRSAILLLVGSLYNNREDVIIGNTASAVSSKLIRGVDWLMASEKLWKF